jgi:hypothetical protein
VCIDEQQAMGNRKPAESWNDLRYFLAVARTGTLSAAAEQLGTEHTTVARHIHTLEGELNSCLFHKSSSHKSNSGYGLTDSGERLLAGDWPDTRRQDEVSQPWLMRFDVLGAFGGPTRH